MSILFIDACIRPVSRTMTLCRAARMTYIYTAGGKIPRDNSAVAYMRDMCDMFGIKRLSVYGADGLDERGCDCLGAIKNAVDEMKA